MSTSVTVAALTDALRAGATPSGEDLAALGERLHARMAALYPLPRSLTGPGVRATLDLLEQGLDGAATLERHEVPTGTRAHDWTITDEWALRRAWITDTATGRVVVDTDVHTLHVVGYSVPVRTTLSRDELLPHLHTLPDRPGAIPYRTSYYHRTWGFCLTQHQLDGLGEGPFEVVVDADLGPGHMTYGEILLPATEPPPDGEEAGEVLLSAHLCHPSLANDNLSGLVLITELVRLLAAVPRRHAYRVVLAPGTVGAVLWLSRNADVLPRIRHGLVLTGLGGPGALVYKRTRRGDRAVDAAVSHVVRRRDGEVRDYSPWGYDERQYNALGFDLPVGRLSRTPHNEYAEYHTSDDDLGHVTPAELTDALVALVEVVDVLENDARPRNLAPYGEPQLGTRGIYPTTGGRAASDAVMAMLWTLAYADGETSLLDVAARADLDFAAIRTAAATLSGADLLDGLG